MRRFLRLHLVGQFFTVGLIVVLGAALSAQAGALPEGDDPLQPGDRVPAFELELLGEDRIITDESMLGQYTLVYFWSTSCGACVREMPTLHEMYEELGSENFEILAITHCHDVNEIHSFREEQFAMPWQHVYLESRERRAEVANKFGARGMPTKVIVSPEGVVLDIRIGYSGEGLVQDIRNHMES